MAKNELKIEKTQRKSRITKMIGTIMIQNGKMLDLIEILI